MLARVVSCGVLRFLRRRRSCSKLEFLSSRVSLSRSLAHSASARWWYRGGKETASPLSCSRKRQADDVPNRPQDLVCSFIARCEVFEKLLAMLSNDGPLRFGGAEHGGCELELKRCLPQRCDNKKLAAAPFRVLWGWMGAERPLVI
jgi:hypothetical protein